MGASRTVRRRPLASAGVITLAAVALTLLVVAGVARRPPPGPVLATIAIGSWAGLPAIGVDEVAGRAYVAARGGGVCTCSASGPSTRGGLTRPGALSVVDERSGQVVRTLAVGAVPLALALDRRHDRLLVGCIGAFGGTPDDPWGWAPGPVRRLLPFLPRPPAPIRTPQGSVLVLDTTRL